MEETENENDTTNPSSTSSNDSDDDDEEKLRKKRRKRLIMIIKTKKYTRKRMTTTNLVKEILSIHLLQLSQPIVILEDLQDNSRPDEKVHRQMSKTVLLCSILDTSLYIKLYHFRIQAALTLWNLKVFRP